MIRVYYADTPNAFKVTIAIAELGLENEWHRIDVMKGEQFAPAFLAINPNHRVPAIVDTAPADGGEPISVFESGAILLYLAEKTGRLLPTDARGKSAVMQWVMWQMAGQGPTFGQLGHFRNYATGPQPYALDRFTREAQRQYALLDTQLRERAFLAGDYSIADIICWPWFLFRDHHGMSLDPYPALQRWFDRIGSRPAVQAALAGAVIGAPAQMTDEARANLFGQGAR